MTGAKILPLSAPMLHYKRFDDNRLLVFDMIYLFYFFVRLYFHAMQVIFYQCRQ